MTELSVALGATPYPGRILVLARTADGALAALYALTGRSEASQRRRIAQTTPNELRVLATEEREHDSLRHYSAGHSDDRWTVLGNGE